MAKTTHPPAPMEALLAAELPDGEGWQYEPKWDGFRALARRDGDDVALTSQVGQAARPLFPRSPRHAALAQGARFLLDGELIIPLGDALSFEALQMRLHPAESRVRRLAEGNAGRADGVRPARSRRQIAAGRTAGQAPRGARTFLREEQGRLACACRPRRRDRDAASTGCVAAAARSTESSPSGSTSNTAPASGR